MKGANAGRNPRAIRWSDMLTLRTPQAGSAMQSIPTARKRDAKKTNASVVFGEHLAGMESHLEP